MKVTVLIESHNAIFAALKKIRSHIRRDEAEEAISEFITDGDIITVVFDTDTGEATVLKSHQED